MTRITSGKRRRLSFSVEEGMILIKEEISYTKPGYARASWDRDIVAVTPDELKTVLSQVEAGKQSAKAERRNDFQPTV